jgi:hypothetical protein
VVENHSISKGSAMTYQKHRCDYTNIALEADDSAAIAAQISEDDFYDMLEAVPPIVIPGGYLMGEPLCDCDQGTVYVMIAIRQGLLFARYSLLGKPKSYTLNLPDLLTTPESSSRFDDIDDTLNANGVITSITFI